MKTEEIMKRQQKTNEEIIASFGEAERAYWDLFGELFKDDPQKFLKFIYFQDGIARFVVRQVQYKVLSDVEDFFTHYPKDCLDSWDVARLIQEDVRKKVLK